MVQQLNNLNPRQIVVPTDDKVVVKQLRHIHQPAKYFGEGPAERRERLARKLVDLTPEERAKIVDSTVDNESNAIEYDNVDEAFYYEGSEVLKRARYKLADFSIQQANYRLDMARIKQLEPATTRLISQQDLIERIRLIDDPETYVDEDTSTTELKTLTSCNFNSDATLMATSCRSGGCKIWSIPDMETHLILKGHRQSANHITFSPKSSTLSPTVANLASCAIDGSVALWNLVDEAPVIMLSEPQSWRVSRVRYHPCGDFLASCCSDKSWRLWDLESQNEILHQEGHSSDVFDIAFHPDGSLAGSAGLDSYARVWDLRTGRAIEFIEGHSGGLRTISFSPNGYHLATAGLDNSVKIWNLRQRKCEYTIPAHLNAVTTVIFEKENGRHLASASFDKTVKFWSTQTWAPIKTLDAYEDKVACIDISADSRYVISCYSKYLKLWTSPSGLTDDQDDDMGLGNSNPVNLKQEVER